MNARPLSADDIRRLFEVLASELDAAGHRAEIFLVGGAAIAVCFDTRRATRDLDAVFAPAGAVRRAASIVADREGLDPDWLNDAVKGFLPGPDPSAVRYFEAPGLLVDVASSEYLLAMKLFSSRAETDAEDIAFAVPGGWISHRKASPWSNEAMRASQSRPGCSFFVRRSSSLSASSEWLSSQHDDRGFAGG